MRNRRNYFSTKLHSSFLKKILLMIFKSFPRNLDVFLLGMAINSLGIIYGIFVLKENSPQPSHNRTNGEIETHEPHRNDTKNMGYFIKDILNKDVFKDCCIVAIKPRKGNGRKIIVSMLLLTVFATAPIWGSVNMIKQFKSR